MRRTFLLTSILLLSASWMLAQYSSGSSATDQQSTSGSQSTGADSGSSPSSQTTTTDEVSPGTQPSSNDSFQSSQSSSSSSDQNAPQGSSGASQTQGSRSESMSSQQGESSSDMSSQDMSSQTGSSARMAPHGGTTSGRTMTFEGCLSQANGKYHLTDKMGTSYELTGKTANLKGHVGHTVSITGKATTSGEKQPGAMSGEQAGMEQTIQVSSFRHVSSNCKSVPSSSPGSSTGGSMY